MIFRYFICFLLDLEMFESWNTFILGVIAVHFQIVRGELFDEVDNDDFDKELIGIIFGAIFFITFICWFCCKLGQQRQGTI